MMVMMSPIATPVAATPITRSPITRTPAPRRAPVAGIETTPTPAETEGWTVAPIAGRAVNPRIIPTAVPATIPSAVPRIIVTAPAIADVHIDTYVGTAVGIIRIVAISIISVTQIQIDLVCSGNRNLARRMVTDDTLGIFRIRTTFLFRIGSDCFFIIHIVVIFGQDFTV